MPGKTVKRSQKALYNIITKLLYQAAALVSGLITPRLIIANFGSAYNGTVSSIVQFLGLISFLTLGVAGATRVALYKPLANGDTTAVSRVLKATELFMRKVGLALLLYTAVLAVVFPFISDAPVPKFEVSLLVVIVAAGTFSQYFFGQTYTFLLQADQSEYIATAFRTVACVIDVFLVILFVNLDATMIQLRAAIAVVSVLTPILINTYVRRHYQLITKCQPDKTALSQRSYAMFHSVANMIHDNSGIYLLTIFTDALIVSVYTVYYGIIRNIKQLMQNFTTGLEGAFGNMWAKGEKTQFSRNFRLYEFLMFAFSSVIFTALGLLLIPFIRLYMAGVKDVNYVRPAFAILVVLAETVFCIRQPYVTIVQATGRYKETRKGAALEAGINLAVSLVLVNIIGLEGVVVGTLVANTFRTVQYMLYSYKELLQRKAWDFVKLIGWHLVNSAATVGIYFAVAGIIGQGTWLAWIACGFLSVIIAGCVTLLTAAVFYRDLLKMSFGVLKRMLSRKRA